MEHGEVLDELKPLVSTPVLLSRVFATFIEVGGCSESKEDDASVELDPQAYASRYPGHRDWHGPGERRYSTRGRAQTWSAVDCLPTPLETSKFIGGSSAIVDVGRFWRNARTATHRPNGGKFLLRRRFRMLK